NEHSKQLAGANIVVFGDHDAPGYAHQDATCKLSLGIAKRVRILKLADHWPEIKEGGDVSDYLDAGHTREQLNALIEQAPDYTAPAGKKPIRIIDGEIARIVDEAEAALLAVADAAPIMVRAGMLVQPIVDLLPASHGRMTEVALLRRLTTANLIYL